MHLIIGLDPIGGNIGAHLAELGQKVYGYDFNADRIREWSIGTASPAGSALAAVDWASVESVHIAVQVTSVFEAEGAGQLLPATAAQDGARKDAKIAIF